MAYLLCHQLLVSQRSGVHNSLHGVMENLRVSPIVESPLQFLQVAVQMLDADLVERSDNRSLEQAPHTFDSVGVNFPDHPFLGGVADRLMPSIGISDPDVGFQFVGVDGLVLVPNVSADEFMEGVTTNVGDALDSDLACLPLDGAGDPGLAFLAPRADVAFLTADQGFVHFDDAKQSRTFKGIVPHRLTNPVTQIPGGVFGSYPQRGLKLAGGDAFLGYAHEVDG